MTGTKDKIRKGWHNRGMKKAEKDPVWAELRARRPADGRYGTQDLQNMQEEYTRFHEIVKSPWYIKLLNKHDKWVYWRRLTWHRFKFEKLHRRTHSIYWHYTHNELWVCDDCDSLYACRDQQSDPDHLCTAQIVDISEMNDTYVDDRDDRPWLDKAICWRCGYTVRLAQHKVKAHRRGGGRRSTRTEGDDDD